MQNYFVFIVSAIWKRQERSIEVHISDGWLKFVQLIIKTCCLNFQGKTYFSLFCKTDKIGIVQPSQFMHGQNLSSCIFIVPTWKEPRVKENNVARKQRIVFTSRIHSLRVGICTTRFQSAVQLKVYYPKSNLKGKNFHLKVTESSIQTKFDTVGFVNSVLFLEKRNIYLG